MFTVTTEYPAVWGALLVLNWPVYVLLHRHLFADKQDLKLSLLAALKSPLFWKDGDAWTAGRGLSYFLICGLVISFEYVVICAVISRVLA